MIPQAARSVMSLTHISGEELQNCRSFINTLLTIGEWGITTRSVPLSQILMIILDPKARYYQQNPTELEPMVKEFESTIDIITTIFSVDLFSLNISSFDSIASFDLISSFDSFCEEIKAWFLLVLKSLLTKFSLEIVFILFSMILFSFFESILFCEKILFFSSFAFPKIELKQFNGWSPLKRWWFIFKLLFCV